MKKVGILTSGGDCQGLNAAIRGVAKALYEACDVEIYGILDGYKGLMENKYMLMKKSDFSGILTLGGTIFKTSRQSYKSIISDMNENNGQKLNSMKNTYKKIGLDCLVILGGNGTHKTANLLSKEGLNIITLPKTIDNDLWGTDMTFGFHSALSVATEVIDRIHTTATSHGRIFIIEIMGHKAGWLNLYAGMAGGADIILIPEIPYKLDKIIDELKKREKNNKDFSIIAVAEGAISVEESKMSKKELKAYREQHGFTSVSYRLAKEITDISDFEIRVAVPGHIQRGGIPVAYDRVLSTRFGTAAARLILDEQYGYMVGLKNNEVVPVPLEQVAGKLKTVPLDNPIVKSAKELGISFGD